MDRDWFRKFRERQDRKKLEAVRAEGLARADRWRAACDRVRWLDAALAIEIKKGDIVRGQEIAVELRAANDEKMAILKDEFAETQRSAALVEKLIQEIHPDE